MINLLKPPIELRNGYKDKKHLARVAQLQCSLCFFLGKEQRTRTTVHHKHGGGLGKKASDRLVMALCSEHHQTGPDAFHHIGRVDFEERFGLTQDELIEITNKLLEDADQI